MKWCVGALLAAPFCFVFPSPTKREVPIGTRGQRRGLLDSLRFPLYISSMAVRIKRVYLPPSPDDGVRILVDRLWPRGLKKDQARIDEWMKDVAPSDALRKWYAHDPGKWPGFRGRYREQLKEKPEPVQRLRALAKKGGLTLLFASKEERLNNAAALKEMIEERR